MRTSTAILALALACFVIASLVPSSDANLSRRKKLMIAKKVGALLLLHRKKYLFAVPFPLPIPIPLLKKTQPIIYKERVPVPVEVPHHVPVPVAEPWPAAEPWPVHGHHAGPHGLPHGGHHGHHEFQHGGHGIH